MSINVTVVGSTNITAVIGNNDGVDVAIGGTLAYSPLTALQVTAGANITITTTSGVYTFIGPDVPVQQVNGQTGNVSITLANLTAAAASHTHVMSDISDLVFPVTKVNGQTGDVSLTVADLTAALAVHTHSTTDVVGFTAAASAAAPVQSVAGRTGIVTLTAGDVGGLAPVATSGSYTSLSNIPSSFTPASHTHQASEITNLTSVANVVSVNGQTGLAVLSSTDVSAASAVHSHVAVDVTDLTSVANVVSVNGITGTPVIVGGSGVTVSTAGSSITIEAGGVTDAGASLSDATPQPLGTAAAGVSSLASRADHVHELPTISYTSLSNVPTAFAPDTSVANVVSVNGQTGVVTINAGDALPTQDGNATRLLTTDGTNASWATRYSVVEPSLLAGTGITFTKNSAVGSITIATDGAQIGDAPITPSFLVVSTSIFLTRVVNGYHYVLEKWNASLGLYALAGSNVDNNAPPGTVAMSVSAQSGAHYRFRALNQNSVPSPWGYTDGAPLSGSTVARVVTHQFGSDQNDYTTSGDIVRLSSSINATITGLAGGEDGVVRVLYNVGTHVVTLSSGNTASAETNRFAIVSGNAVLGEGDSASVWYDGTSQRWRVLEDQVTGASGGSGGGIAMAYLFGG